MNRFYRLYSDIEIAHQLDAQIFINEITPQVGAQIDKNIVFMIPWGHHKVIMDKCKEDQQKALFFVQKALENNGFAFVGREYRIEIGKRENKSMIK